MRKQSPTRPSQAPLVDLRRLLRSADAGFGDIGGRFAASTTQLGPGMSVQQFDGPGFRGEVFHCLIATDLAIMIASYGEAPRQAMRGIGDGLLMLNLRLEGEAINESDDPTVDGRASLTYYTPGSVMRWRLPHGGPWRTVTVYGTPAAYDARWGLGGPLLESLGAQPAMFRRHGQLLRRPWTVTREAFEILRALIHRRFDGPVLRAYVEARAQQLACEFLAAGALEAPHHGMPTRTRELVCRARAAIVEDPAQPHTLLSLARRFGLNRTLLAEGFRAEFGETVFECLQRERLRRAWALLQGSQAKVTAVALQVGYRDSASFARAFKTHFGVTPTQVPRASARTPPQPDAP